MPVKASTEATPLAAAGDGTRNAKQSYARRLCDQQSAQVSDATMEALGRDAIKLDLGAASKSDVLVALGVFVTCPSFKVCCIRGASARGSKKPGHHRERAIETKELVSLIVRGIMKNRLLQVLELDALPDLLVKKLPTALKNSAKHLKKVHIKNMHIPDAVFVKILQTLMSAEITDWSFSGCGLSSAVGKDLRGLLQIHCNRRNCKQWQYGLREEQCNPHLEGAIRLDISNNPLGDDGALEVVEALAEDQWLIALDLATTKITDNTVKALIDILETNATLCSVVINDVGLSEDLVRNVSSTLEKHRLNKPFSADVLDQYDPPLALSRVKKSQGCPAKSASMLQVTMPTSTPYQKPSIDFGSSDDPLVSGVEDMLRKVVQDLEEHENSRKTMQTRIDELETENGRLQTEITRLKSSKGTPRNTRRRRRKRPTGHKAVSKSAAVDAGEVDQLAELVGFLEKLFKRLHLYMDELESMSNEKLNSESDQKRVGQMTSLSAEVKKSSDIFDQVALRVNAMNSRKA